MIVIIMLVFSIILYYIEKKDKKKEIKQKKCKEYYLVTESNEDAAAELPKDRRDFYHLITESNVAAKYQFLSNIYPEFKVLRKVYLGCLDSDQLKEAQKMESSVLKNINGVPFTIKVTVKLCTPLRASKDF
jgi:hypothetical protein